MPKCNRGYNIVSCPFHRLRSRGVEGVCSVGDEERAWVLLTYTLPREPSSPRVALWRKLRKLGAILAHDAVWTLPATPATREHMRWLAQEIREAGGEAQVWMARGELPEQDAQLVSLFLDRAENGYQEIMRALDDPARFHADLARSYRQVRAIDYFHAPSGDVVRARLERLDSGHSADSVTGDSRGIRSSGRARYTRGGAT
jgi:ketosteroid isomerase-like protein